MAKMIVEVGSTHTTVSVETHPYIQTDQRRAALRRVEMELDEADEMVCVAFLVFPTG